jgi:hypothetical protein
VLGVPEGATPAQIKKAWRKMAFRSHPDRGGDPSAFKQGYAAYQYLIDHPANQEKMVEEFSTGLGVERDFYQAQAQLYVDAWNRVPPEIRFVCNVIYPIWIVLALFFAWPGTAGGILFFLAETFGPPDPGKHKVGALMLCIGVPLMLSLVCDWWGKLRYFLMDYYSRRSMRRLG